jgi:tRNA threonylcarbamoyladenosine modification (KEOPS) complex  Pcc1 subunit
MSTKAAATIRLNLGSQKQLDALINALKPEADAPPTHRSTVKLQKDGACLVLAAEAEDTVALRATLNAYLRWINSILNVMDAIKKQ